MDSICEVSVLFTQHRSHTLDDTYWISDLCCFDQVVWCMLRISYEPSLELVRGNGMCNITMLFGGCCVILCDGSVDRCFRVVSICSTRFLLFCEMSKLPIFERVLRVFDDGGSLVASILHALSRVLLAGHFQHRMS